MSRVLVDRQRSGRYRVRVENPDGKLKSLGTFPTWDEAQHIKAHMRFILHEKGLPREPLTLRKYGTGWLDRRAKTGVKSIRADRSRWKLHVMPHELADLPLPSLRRVDVRRWRDELGEKDATRRGRGGELVSLGHQLGTKTIRECLLLLHACLVDAVDDGVLLSNPADGVKLPRLRGSKKALSYLYPDEDRRLLACAEIPLEYRLFYGFLAREGMRKGEALSLSWDEVDLDRGAVRLDHNKTDDPRAWRLQPGVVRALSWWRKRNKTDQVFLNASGGPLKVVRAKELRRHLARAGVDRPELYEQNATRLAIRVHDLRATFVTLSLAAGRTETWVQDRTGHTTNYMLQRYRRASRTLRELELGALTPLDEALPEAAAEAAPARGSASGWEMIRAGGNRPASQRVCVGRFPLKTHGPSGRPGSSPGGATSGIVDDSATTHLTPIQAADHFADHASAFIAAARAEDDERAEAHADALAHFAEPLTDRAAELVEQIRAGGPHKLRRTVELIDLLTIRLPQLDADDAAAAGGERQ